MVEGDFKQRKDKRTTSCSFSLDIVFKSCPPARPLFGRHWRETKQIFVTLTSARHERQRQLSTVDCCQLYFQALKMYGKSNMKNKNKKTYHFTLIKHLFGHGSNIFFSFILKAHCDKKNLSPKLQTALCWLQQWSLLFMISSHLREHRCVCESSDRCVALLGRHKYDSSNRLIPSFRLLCVETALFCREIQSSCLIGPFVRGQIWGMTFVWIDCLSVRNIWAGTISCFCIRRRKRNLKIEPRL